MNRIVVLSLCAVVTVNSFAMADYASSVVQDSPGPDAYGNPVDVLGAPDEQVRDIGRSSGFITVDFGGLYPDKPGAAVGVWLMDKTTEDAWQSLGNHGTDWEPGCIADYNGDGSVDVVYHNSRGMVGVWLMDGTKEDTWKPIGNHGSWEVR